MHRHFEGCLTTRDCKRHIPHLFTVPVHGSELDICLRFAPYRVRGISNMITLTLFDPHGFRGAGHRVGDAHEVHIATDEATPGYLPGPLPAGVWDAQIDTHMVMPGEPVHYWLDITVAEDAGEATASRLPAPPHRPPPRGAGWYRGDLHTHTDHSDAEGCTAGAQMRLLANGRLLDQRPAGERGKHEWDMAPEQAGWVLVEVRAEDGGLLAVTNPIYNREVGTC